jgi:hypothetical protein
MGPNVWLPVDGVEFHARRDCRSLTGSRQVDAVPAEARRLVMFDPCPRCVTGATAVRREQPVAPTAAMLDLRSRPASTRERVRTEAVRRGVTFLEWATRVARLATPNVVIDLNEAERVVDLNAERQSASVTS